MDQAGSVEVDSTQDINSKADDEGTSNPEGSNSQPEEFISMPDEEQPQTMEEAGDMNSKSQEKPVEAVEEDIVDVPTLLTQDTLEESDVMEWDALAGDTSEVHKETNGDKLCSSSVDSSEECEAANMAVVIMDEEFPSHSENSNNESNVLDKETSDPTSSESHEFEKEDSVNPLANSSEQEKTNKESESNALEAVAVEMNSLEESDSEEICTSSKTNEDSSSSETNLNKSKTLEQANRQEKKSKKPNSSEHLEDGTASEVVSIAEVVVESSKSKPDEGEDIVELPVQKQPAMLVDLENEDEVVGESQGGSPYQTDDNVSNLVDDNATNSDGKRIKLRSLASLVDISGGEDPPANPVVSTSHPDIPAIGEIVEHGVIIGSDEMDGLQLRISNVVGGEDCITGLTVDEDRDSFSSIQISSVTTLIEPMSPEDPNKVNEKSENSQEGESSGEPSVKARAAEGEGKTSESTTEAQNSKPEVADGDMNCVVVSSKGDGKSTSGKDGKPSEERDKPSEERDKPSEEKDSESNESASPKIQHSGAISQTAKGKECGPPRHIYHILRSILTMKRECHFCFKTVQCEFRIVKKGVSGPWGFLCSPFCRSQWTTSLASNHVLEKPRLIFEKLCGMCGSDLANLTRDGQYSWETREFCSKNCLTTHMTEVAGKCHTCRQTVRSVFIGKYCVRFGSDIHQFCSNTCLEHYKTKIKVCCYCQKNLDKVDKVTSVSNKEYCSTKCLKRAQRRDIGQQNYSDHLACTVCQNSNLNRYEFVSNQESFQLCSDPCLNVYKYANKVKAVTCCLCFRIMNAEDVAHYLYHGGHQLRVFCSDSCVNVFILSARKIVVCEICKVKKYNFDMIHRQVDEDFRDYFYCSLSCLCTKEQSSGKKTKNGVTSSSAAKGSVTSSSSSDPPVTDCNMCNAKAKAQYHMVMSDNTLRSFCRYACATKYKNTFGYQVNGIQNADSTQNSLPVIREVASQEAPANQSEDKENTSKTKKKNGIDPAEEISSVTAELLRLLTPPTMVNKMTSCRPSTLTKGVFCKPYPWHRQTQTASSDINCSLYTEKPPPIIPVPIPVYVPSPMMMYNMPYPVPVFVPIPLPVPIFIPTTAKTTEDIAKQMKNIREEMPEDPYEAEMLLLARASSESAQGETREAAIQENNSLPDGFDSHIADIDDLKDLDVSCLDTVEEDVPRYPLKPLEDAEIFDSNPASDAGDSDENEQNKKKRKVENDWAPGQDRDTPAVTRKDARGEHLGRGMLFFAMNPWLRAVVAVGGGLLACVSSQGAPAPDYLDDNFLYEMRSLLDTPEAWRGVSGGGHPRAVEGWGPELQLGQVSGVSVDPQGRPVLFHRGTRVWDHRTFNVTHHYQGEDGPLGEDVVLVLDPESGAVVRSWGAGHFLLPHGLTVDQRGNTWLTDVGLHQVFKFPPGGEEPELILGEPRVPGSDNTHFCKPTSVAVASSGDFFVADGYCNARVLRFAPDGVLKDKFGHPGRDGSPSSLYVPHGLALDESLDSLCVADRENRRVVCMRAGVQEPDVFGEHLRTLQDPYHGRVFDVAAFKGALVSVGGSEGESAAMGFTTDLRDGQLKDMWRPSRGFHNPHAVALSGDGTAIYVAEIGPNRVWKFVVDSNGVGTRAMY